MTDTVISLGDDRYKCRNCGRIVKTKTLPIHCDCRVSRGLGDTIAKLARAIGIKPCGGCKKRQRLLNKLIPYRQEQ